MTTRRNFIKGMLSGLVGFSVLRLDSLENIPSNPNVHEEETESGLHYSVSDIKSPNPCGEIIFAGSREEAEGMASSWSGVVNYSGIINGKNVKGSYRPNVLRRII